MLPHHSDLRPFLMNHIPPRSIQSDVAAEPSPKIDSFKITTGKIITVYLPNGDSSPEGIPVVIVVIFPE